MSINTRQQVGMFKLQCLGVKLRTWFVLKIFSHFSFWERWKKMSMEHKIVRTALCRTLILKKVENLLYLFALFRIYPQNMAEGRL